MKRAASASTGIQQLAAGGMARIFLASITGPAGVPSHGHQACAAGVRQPGGLQSDVRRRGGGRRAADTPEHRPGLRLWELTEGTDVASFFKAREAWRSRFSRRKRGCFEYFIRPPRAYTSTTPSRRLVAPSPLQVAAPPRWHSLRDCRK